MLVRVTNNKKSGEARPYVARLTAGMQREWGSKVRRKQWTDCEIEVAGGDVIDGRAVTWTGREFAGGHFFAVAIDGHGLHTITRDAAAKLVADAAEGWRVVDAWSVDDGETPCGLNGEALALPIPAELVGAGDCGGFVQARADERRLTPVQDQVQYFVARLEGGFPIAEFAPELAQAKVYAE